MRFSLSNFIWCIALFSLLAMLSAPVYAQSGFVRIDGITCSSVEDNYRGWCEITNFSWGTSNTASTGGTAAGAKVGDINLLKNFDKGSPKIFEAVAYGRHFAEVKIVLVRSRVPYVEVTLRNVIFTAANYGLMQEGFSLSFDHVDFLYRFQDQYGRYETVQGSWDKPQAGR